MPGGQHCLVQPQWKWVHQCLGSRLTFDPKHAQLGSCLNSKLASTWPQHLVSPKRLPCHALYGARLCHGDTHNYVQTPRCPRHILFLRIWMYRCWFMAPSTTTSSLLPSWWVAPHTMTDRPQIPSSGWTQASIGLSPCLRHPRTRPSLWYRENRDSSLKIQCLHCLRSDTLCLLPHSRRRRLCSNVTLGHLAARLDQYPAARSRLRMVRTDIHLPNRRIICICRLRAEMKQFILTIWSSWRSYCSVVIFIENFHLPTAWRFAAVFALANYMAWSPLTVQRNINSLYRNPTLHKSITMVMARQSSLQVTTLELIFFLLLSLSGPQTILTVFGHSIW